MKGMKPPVQYCAVSGKVMYDKRGAVTSRNKRWDEDHVELRIYPCQSCKAWHLTSQFNRPRKRRK